MYKVILMDLDNTILNFDSAEKHSFTRALEFAGLEYNDALLLQYKKINQSLWHDLELGKITKEVIFNTRFRKFFEMHEIEINNEEVEKIFRSSLNDSAELIQGAELTLRELRKMGKKYTPPPTESTTRK